MTQKTRAAVETEISSLLADNGTGAITAANVRTVVNDICDSAIFPLTDTTTPLTLAGVLLSNGTALTTDTTTAHTALIQGYSTTAVGYITLGTITNGASATLALNAPTNGALTINNAVIGGTTPAAATFTSATLTGLLTESAASGLTALTGGQGGALALTKEVNQFSTVTAGFGAALPLAVAGLTIYIINNGAGALQVYGGGTDTIDGIATATGVSQMPGSLCLYTCVTTAPGGKWISEGLGTGYAGSLQTFSYADALTANGTTNASTAAITTALARFTTVGSTTNNSCVLPAAAPGLEITVLNAGANPLYVFGAGADQINGASAAAQVPVNGSLTFNATVAAKWHVQTVTFDVIDNDVVRCSSTLTATSNTTLATATGLSINLTAGATYRIRGHLYGTAAAAGGLKAQLIASNSLSLTSAEITGVNYNGVTTNARTTVTALAADFANSNAAYTDCEFEGTLVVNAAGTINLQAAQNTSNASSTTVLAGSFMEVRRIS